MKTILLICSILLIASARADVEFSAGRWRISFSDADERLALRHADGFAAVEGRLSATGPARVTGAGVGRNDTAAAWRVVSPRDGARERLALVDTRDNVDGYITFQADGDSVSMLVYHRTAFAYSGTLAFDGEIRYRADAYPCALAPHTGSANRVLSIKSGFAVSSLDDALFSPSVDEALQLSNATLKGAEGAVSFSAFLEIDNPSANSFTARVVKDWYKSRWVPYWRPPNRARAPHAPTGWLSWNTYFDTAGSKENLDEARFAAKWFKPFGMEVWNIESWQDNSQSQPVSKFHNMNLETCAEQFPEGMKWLADEIRRLGFTPGIWMAPFGTGNEAFYREHKEWFLHRADGTPVSCWNGRFTLDPTVSAAREHLKHIFDVASHEWGYGFFKIDGMSGRNHGYCAHLYERPEIRACFVDPTCPNPFELCIKAFREGIGDDRVFLACQGHFTGAEAAYADASRTGADIVHPNQPVKWENILLQARCTINQFFAHANVFWSDPDCMLVSQDALAREQAQVEATVVALPGQQTFAGDKLAELAPDRVRLIQQALPACPTRPGALYPQFDRLPVWDLHVARPFGDWHVVALFNWDDEEKPVGADIAELGEATDRAFIGREFWTGSFLGRVKGRLEMDVPARGVRLVVLQRDLGRPQFLSSDRHITQGAVELRDVRWQDSTLRADVDVVGGFPQTVRFAVPEGWSLKSVAASSGATAVPRMEADGHVLAVELSSDETATVSLAASF